MATLKQRLHRKNSSGSYDTIHLETSSSLVLRPSGRTVEQDLEAYLPKVQNSDTVPESLNPGQPMTGTTKAWLGRFGEVGHPYTHPSAKQCSYAYTHPTTKQCNYAYTHPSTKQCDAAAGNHTHSGYAASSHNHSAANITSGTLAVARGGTGVTSLDALKSSLGIAAYTHYSAFTVLKTQFTAELMFDSSSTSSFGTATFTRYAEGWLINTNITKSFGGTSSGTFYCWKYNGMKLYPMSAATVYNATGQHALAFWNNYGSVGGPAQCLNFRLGNTTYNTGTGSGFIITDGDFIAR